MRAIVQRVKRTTLSVEERLISEISHGLTVYLGIFRGDTEAQAAKMAKKIVALRIFENEAGKMTYSVRDTRGEILLVSQFTLCADCSHGNRPDFLSAEAPAEAERLYLRTAQLLEDEGVTVRMGVFGADMQIEQHNDGPVTILLEF